MITVFHGTTKLFKEFRPQDTIGTGEGKSKFGWGTYLTSAFATAVLYSGKGPGREAAGHYVYSVEIPNPVTNESKYFVLHKPVPSQVSSLVEKEIGQIKDRSALEWGNDFRTELETMLFIREYGRKPKGKSEVGTAQKLCADWFYKHGIIGIAWPHGTWPQRGLMMPVENLNVAMFHGSDIHITMVERVEVEFKAKSKNTPDKVTCIEKKNSERITIDIDAL